MGKSKKTRWRTFSFDGSKDETQIINGDVNLNGTDLSSQKYSQILGDHHTNYLSQLSSKSSTSPTGHHPHNHHNSNSNNNNNFRSRSYNKENYYNQRSVVKNNLAPKNSWQRSSNTSAFRTATATVAASSTNTKDNGKSDDGKSDGTKLDGTSSSHTIVETIKFNEDEYTRITTPRQDVLFKKGYLSRMNSNKTANNTSTTSDSTAPNSTVTTTNSDPESSLSVSTLSPATTPSMDFGQMDPLDYAAPIYYPGYYDESGMLVFPMYNGYNYYPPNGSTSPVYLMPYPYQYDPFFMAPNTEVSQSDNTDEQTTAEQNGNAESEETEEKEEDDEEKKENNQSAAGEEQNGARMSSCSVEDATSNGSDHSDELKNDEKDAKQKQNDEVTSNELNEQTPKQCFPIYANELGYIYPYANGFYNGFYYYNGVPASSTRPPKGKRRKRFSSSRSSHSHPPPRSAETTTDYSDDDGVASTHNRRYYSRYHHGFKYYNGHHHHYHHHHQQHHHNSGYNQYHYNSKYHPRAYVDQNANQAPQTSDEKEAHQESNLNVNVVEFYPRVHSSNEEPKEPKNEQESKCDVPVNDLEKQNSQQQQQQPTNKANVDAPTKNNNNINNNNGSSGNAYVNNSKPSHSTSKSMGRISKKDIMDGIKLMEQQNINLKATSKAQLMSAASNSIDADAEWNVIKKGKKVKVVKDSQSHKNEEEASRREEPTIEKEMVAVAAKPSLLSQEPVSNKKTIQPSPQPIASVTNNNFSNNSNNKSKKVKGKNGKKKKTLFMSKQDGFEIIEPDFGSSSNNTKNSSSNHAIDKECEEVAFDEEEGDTTVVEEEEAEEEEKVKEETPDEVIKTDNDAIACEEKPNEIISNHESDDVVDVTESEVKEQLIVDQETEEVEPEMNKKAELTGQAKEKEEEKKDEKDEEEEGVTEEAILKMLKEVEMLKEHKNGSNHGNKDDAVIDISDEEICRKTSIEIDLSIAQEIANIEKEPVAATKSAKKKEKSEKKAEEEKKTATEPDKKEEFFEDSNYFNDRKNIAELERDLMENLKILDDGIDIKSPTINPLYDFPITSAVRKWLQERQHESFENLFRVENFKKISELLNDYDDDEDDDDESDISDSPQKSETTDSDYASDIQVKQNGSPASSNAKLDTKTTSKCNNKLIVKESFCALM